MLLFSDPVHAYEVAGEGFELPERAVQLANDDSRYVWIVKEGKARRQSISVADLTRTGVLISNGLQDGDTVIVDGMESVGCPDEETQRNHRNSDG